MKSEDKIAYMHDKFGKCDGHKCKECDHYGRYQMGNKVVRKCSIYGVTHSVATDWKMSFDACGAFNKNVMEKLLYRENAWLHSKRKRLNAEKGSIDQIKFIEWGGSTPDV